MSCCFELPQADWQVYMDKLTEKEMRVTTAREAWSQLEKDAYAGDSHPLKQFAKSLSTLRKSVTVKAESAKKEAKKSLIACKAVEDGPDSCDVQAKWQVVVSDFSDDVGVTAYANPLVLGKSVIIQTTTDPESIDKLILDVKASASEKI